MTRFKTSLISALCLGFLGLVAPAEVIRLQAKVAVNERQDVRLGDIATISGGNTQQNEELAEMVIVSSVQRSQKVKAESVLIAVMAQRGSGSLGTLQISGAAECEINLAGSKVPAQAPAVAPTILSNTSLNVMPTLPGSPDVPSQPVPSPARSPAATLPAPATAPANVASALPTLRETVMTTLKKAIDLPEGDYRIVIDSVNVQLDQPVAKGQVWVCRAMTKSILGTVQVESQLVVGPKALDRLVISTTVTHKQLVVVLTKMLGRGDIVTPDTVRVEARQLDRKWPNLFTSMSDVVGLEAQRPMTINDMADQTNFKPAMMAHKGDILTVICISGRMQLQIQGQALEEGKMHDRVQVRNESTGNAYSVMMIARGIGVAGATLTEEQEKKIVEAVQ